MIWNPIYIREKGTPLPSKDTLENMTWADISTVSKAGKASEYWKVGDTKSILFTGTTYYVQIIGFDHDDVTDSASYGRSKAGITFQFGVADSKSPAGMFSSTVTMNNSSSNVNGWSGCVMRTTTMKNMKNYLPSDLQSVLVAVNKLTGSGNKLTTINTTSDELFLLSEIEIFNKSTNSAPGEGLQYKFYADGNQPLRYSVSGSAVGWWERSPALANNTNFCYVNTLGNASHFSATTSNGVSFGFCV